MKAAIFSKHGSSDNLLIKDIDKPIPADNEVLIQVRYCALNRLDIWTRMGPPVLKIPLPHVGGSDLSGIVVEVGSKVDPNWMNKHVMVNAGISCRGCDRCLEGEHSLCDTFSMIGEHHWGGLAEYTVIPETNIIEIPESISMLDSAAMGLTLLTSYRMLVTRAHISKNDIVLIIGASGGVGTASLQLVKHFGATTICLAGSDEKSDKLRELGADYVINYKQVETWSKKVYSISKSLGQRGVDIVVDSVGESVFEQAVRSLRKGGTYVSCGATSGNEGKLNLALLFWKQLKIIGSTMANDKEFREAMQLFFDGHVKPAIDTVYSLHEIKEAHDRLEAGLHFGKIVISIP